MFPIKSFYFLLLNLILKLGFWFFLNIKIWKNLFGRKIPYKIEFIFQFYIEICKFCRNEPVFDWNITIIWFWDNVKNFRTRFVFQKYGSNQQTVINKIISIFNFTKVSKNLVQIGPLVLEIQNVSENVCSIFFNMNLFENYEYLKKKSSLAKQFYVLILRPDTNFV